MVLLLLEISLSPLLVAAGSAAQRRLGPRRGGLVIGLPLTALPLLALVSLAHGPAFAAGAARACLEGTAAQALLVWVYAAAVGRLGPVRAIGVALATFGAGIAVLDALPAWPALLGAGAGIAGCAAALRWWPGPGLVSGQGTGRGQRLALRMTLAAGFAFAVSTGSGHLGAHLAGLVTDLPVLTLVMGALTHSEEGGPATAEFLEGVMRGSFAVVTSLTVLAVLLARGHDVGAFTAAAVAAVATQLVVSAPARPRVAA